MSIYTCMDSVGTLQRPVISRDSAQGVTQSAWTTIVCNFPCSAQQSGASRMAFYQQMSASISSNLYTAQNIEAQENDRIKIVDRTGRTYWYNVDGQTQPVGRGIQWQTAVTLVQQPSDGGVNGNE